MLDDPGPHPVVEEHLAVLELVLEVDVDRPAAPGASAIWASARSWVVTRPIAPRSIRPRTTASAPTRAVVRVGAVEELVEQEQQRDADLATGRRSAGPG